MVQHADSARHSLLQTGKTMRFLIAMAVVLAASPAWAQAFANAKSSLANYSVADRTPQKMCESLSAFKGEDIVSIEARVVPASGDTPQHCRVLGVITPEVAFEINLPERWNRRFYMTGNGGFAGEALDAPNNPDRINALINGFVMARTNTGHDARKSRAARSSSATHKRRSTTPIARCM